jgi:chromosome segregation ATPase
MDSDIGGGKSRLDFSDIMSILDEDDQKKPEPKAVKKAELPRDNAFVTKLLSDIEHKNAEILKLSSENMSLKYSLSEKDMEIKKLRSQAESLNGQAESLKAQVIGLSRQIEDLNKYVSDARIKLGEMDADRAKLTSRIVSHNEVEKAPPEEDDIASIFKRIALKGEEPAGDNAGDGADKPEPLKKIKTAKLYDL